MEGTDIKKYEHHEAKAAETIIEYLKTEMGIQLLKSDFALSGYMYSNRDLFPKVSFWRGRANAIGFWHNEQNERDEYVIVDWRSTPDLPNFWNSEETFGRNLHQCLLYAKLLQVHLGLDYLPSVLIVPISSDNGKDYQPGHFVDYPDECKKMINDNFSWLTEFPESLPYMMYGKASLIKEDVFNKLSLEDKIPVNIDTRLETTLNRDATFRDLFKAFGLNASSLTIICEK